MIREVHFDVTHLASRFWTETPAGIDRVDLAFARSLLNSPTLLKSGVHQGPLGASRVGPKRVTRLVRNLERRWLEDLGSADKDPLWSAVMTWLRQDASTSRKSVQRIAHDRSPIKKRFRAHTFYRHSFAGVLPALGNAAEASIYLNTSQAGLTLPNGLDWLGRRRDVKAVFFIHDLLPVQHPELFPDVLAANFRNLLPNLARHADGLIFASDSVRSAVSSELAGLGRRRVPSFVTALPETGITWPSYTNALPASPYFVALGTIEPRKNHALLLDAWDAMLANSAKGHEVPKLVIVGSRGWKNEGLLKRLDAAPALAGHVLEVSGLSTPAVSSLLAHSAGLLFPTLSEGFGLPLSEARALSVPALASDIDVFRERSLTDVTLLPLNDLTAWIEAIQNLTRLHGDGSEVRNRIASAAARPTNPDDVLASIEPFLADL
jgi:glycosyltransferase involved in cell wall biosynthesis